MAVAVASFWAFVTFENWGEMKPDFFERTWLDVLDEDESDMSDIESGMGSDVEQGGDSDNERSESDDESDGEWENTAFAHVNIDKVFGDD